MEAKLPAAGDPLYLERRLKLLETPFVQVCQVLGLEDAEPDECVQVGNSVFLFDSQKDHVFAGAVILDDAFGFYGVSVGANWLDSAGRLESQGFVQSEDLERFTKPGPQFGVSVYLYHDDSADASSSTVTQFCLCPRYGRTL